MDTDAAITALAIQMMPLLMREFHLKLDSGRVVADAAYAAEICALASRSASDRLRSIAVQLEIRLQERSHPGPQPQEAAPAPARPQGPGKYVRSLR